MIWAGFELLLNSIGLNQIKKETILGILGIPILFSIQWLYYAFFESSKIGATPGKIALGIIVVDSKNNKISFGRASARYWSKIISTIVLIGFVMGGLTSRKQALHDLIANTYVVNKYELRINDGTKI